MAAKSTKKPKTKKTITSKMTFNGETIPKPEEINPEVFIEGDIDTTVHESLIVEAPSRSELMKSPEREAAFSIVGGVTAEELRQALKVQTEQRDLIQQFIKDNLVEDIDYGKIHIIKSCAAEEKRRGSCDRPYHFSKSILLKPGQEKIFSLFGITDDTQKDPEAYEMFANISGLVAYKCILYRGDRKVGEGGGAALLSQNQNDPNSTIKKARKRAKMDACLSLGFSAYFTQDLDDPEYKSQREMMNEKAAAEAERRDKDEFGLLPRDPNAPIDAKERPMLFKMILTAGVNKYYVIDSLRLNGIEKPESMTSGQARGLMGLIKEGAFKIPVQTAAAPSVPEPIQEQENLDPVYVDDPQLSPNMDRIDITLPKVASKIEQAELIVDEDLKKNVKEVYKSLGLNARGDMWFKRLVTGRPFGDWEKYTDAEWRKAFTAIEEMQVGILEVEDCYIAGVELVGVRDPSEPTSEQDHLQNVQIAIPGATKVN